MKQHICPFCNETWTCTMPDCDYLEFPEVSICPTCFEKGYDLDDINFSDLGY